MGMGKGQQNSSNVIGGIRRSAGGSSSRYGFMIIVGFGAAVFGVMVLHKLRERRIFDLLLKDKDQQLFALQLLLQKERDHVKEAKRKADEMKAKIYYLRTQKLNLDNRILELGSTISSMKDGSQAVEMELARKEEEIKQLKERESEYDNKVTPLTEMIRQKEAEIESMKRHMEQPVKVWSVSTDESSSPQVNLTEAAIMANNNGGGSESANNSNGENSRKGEDGRKNEGEVADKIAKAREEQPQKLEDSLEENVGNGSTTSGTHRNPGHRENLERSQVVGISGIGNEEQFASRAQEKNTSVEVQNHQDEDSNRESHLQVHARSVKSENDESGESYRGLVKLEMRDTNKRKAEGRRSRIIAKHRMPGNKGKSKEIGFTWMGLGSQTFFKGSLENERNKTQRNGDTGRADDNEGLNIADELKETDIQAALDQKDEKESVEGENVKKHQLDTKITCASMDVNLLRHEDTVITRNSRDKGGNTKSNQPGVTVQEMNTRYINSERLRVKELRSNRTVCGEDNGINSGAETDNKYEQLNEEARYIHEDVDPEDVDQEDNASKQGKARDKKEDEENLEVEDVQESDTDTSRESSSTLEDDKEEYVETNGPEF